MFSIPFDIFGNIGNWIFIFISGWFLTGKSFSWKKLGALWFQICSISIIVTVVVYITNIKIINYSDVNQFLSEGYETAAKTITMRSFVRSLLPFYFSSNWYGSAYTIFFLLLPLLDKAVSCLSKKEHKRFTLLLIALSQIRLAPGQSIFNPSKVIIFIVGFFLIKYVKIYMPEFLKNKKRNVLIALGLLVLHWSYKFVCAFVFYTLKLPDKYFIYLSRIPDNVACFLPMIIGLLIFCNLKDVKIPHSKVINTIASTTFGIYLIHEHPLINYWWCHRVLKLSQYTNFISFTCITILMVFVTFAVCCAIEMIRKYLLEKAPLMFLSSLKHKEEK